MAAFLGHPEVITLLLEKGANIEKPTLRGETTLHMAARANQMDVMRLLLRNHANVDAKAKVGALKFGCSLHLSCCCSVAEKVTTNFQ